eukprot:Hpha_TRINITY_DN15717_c2_g1::TRINITY_DN15717_c2_g1_i3::g.36637::m.36637/K17914/KIF13; kinesin family member 13
MALKRDTGASTKAAVTVAVRVRPFNSRELGGSVEEFPTAIVRFEGDKVDLLNADDDVEDTFHYHNTFWSIPAEQQQVHCRAPFASQEDVYKAVGEPCISHVFAGYHSCVFAYGQTGSGKTHTMLGTPQDPGVAPRVIGALFSELEKRRRTPQMAQGWEYNVEVSFMEIYNERVKDLLAREDLTKNVTTPAISSIVPDAGRHSSAVASSTQLDGDSTDEDTEPPESPASLRVTSPTVGHTPTISFADDFSEIRSGFCFGEQTPPVPSLDTAKISPRVTKKKRASSRNSPSGDRGDGGTSPRMPSALSKTRSMLKTPRDREEGYADLRVRHSKQTGTFVDGLKRFGETDVGELTAADVVSVMKAGMQHRAQAATAMNDTSSRSHAIFQIFVTATSLSKGIQRYAHINLVDLAGSERLKMSKSEGQALKEATRINLSLSTLRRVIDVLIANSTRKKKQGQQGYMVPPYRDSLLTWVLSETLGGNSCTSMIATVSPHDSNREDTVNTLRYALKAKSVTNTVRVNDTKTKVVVTAMQSEIEQLRQQLVQDSAESEEVFSMRQRERELAEDIRNKNAESEHTQAKLEKQQKDLEFQMLRRRKASIDVRQLRGFVDEEWKEAGAEAEEADSEAYKAHRRLSLFSKEFSRQESEVLAVQTEKTQIVMNAASAFENTAMAYEGRVGMRNKLWRQIWRGAINRKLAIAERADAESLRRMWCERGDHAALDCARVESSISEHASDLHQLKSRIAVKAREFDRKYAPSGQLDARDEQAAEDQRNAVREASTEDSFLNGSVAGDDIAARRSVLADVAAAYRVQDLAIQECKRNLATLDRETAEQMRWDNVLLRERKDRDLRRTVRLREMIAQERARGEEVKAQQKELAAELSAYADCAAALRSQNAKLQEKLTESREEASKLSDEVGRMRSENTDAVRDHAALAGNIQASSLELDRALFRQRVVAGENDQHGARHRELRKFTEAHFFSEDRRATGPSHGEQRRAEQEIDASYDGFRAWNGCGYRYRPTSPARAAPGSGESIRNPSPGRASSRGEVVAPRLSQGPVLTIMTPPGGQNGSRSPPPTWRSTPPPPDGGAWGQGHPLSRRVNLQPATTGGSPTIPQRRSRSTSGPSRLLIGTDSGLVW